MNYMDLNSDLGESFGTYTLGMDEALMDVITSANVACGWHAGDPTVMEKTLRVAAEKGVAVGAHPGYADLMGFGRREMKITPDEAYAYVLYQLGAIAAFARVHKVKLQHVKPHGALYNQACKDEKLAMAICRAAQDFDRELMILAPYNSAFRTAAEAIGQPFAAEFFADRAYMPDGSLVPRSQPGAVIHDPDEACRRVLQMAREGTVTCIDGTVLNMRCASVCVHGDNEAALASVKKIRAALESEGVVLRPMGAK
ncbi:MAG: LamB/YcsF family protein [Clostridia bacterium]|nr:LamB/YcsF family protein [Clostridia bacterium]